MAIVISAQSVLYCGQRLLTKLQINFYSGLMLRFSNSSNEMYDEYL